MKKRNLLNKIGIKTFHVGKSYCTHIYCNFGLYAIIFICVVGKTGQPIPLITNFFKLQAEETWNLYQYHVDFNPQLESKRLRIALLHSHAKILGGTRAFDGMVLFMPEKLQEEVS